MNRNLGTSLVSACTLASMAFLSACSSSGDKDVSGGASGDMGIVADVITGDAQKGPFANGSVVTVQGIDCKTMALTDEHFDGVVRSDMGDFAMKDIALSTSCAVFEVTGKYLDELTGKKSAGEITLHALTNLKDRKTVNVNVLTELEYERVMHLVTEKGKTFADAKARAEKEVLAAFGIEGDFDNSEDLTIFESGDGNAALLAVSVLMLAETDDAGLAKRIEKFADSFAEIGKWDDDKTKATIEKWQVAATADGTLDSIRKNVEGWGYADVVPAFEKYIEAFGDTVILSSDSESSSSATPQSSSSSTNPESVEVSSSSSAKANADSEYDATANTLTDLRDGKVYKTVKIGSQVWMAENLNYETDVSSCYRDSAKCTMYGRFYAWSEASKICPDGWHLPDTTEWNTLFSAVGGRSTAGKALKSKSGWYDNGDRVDAFGFGALPAGNVDNMGYIDGDGNWAMFWSSTESGSNTAYLMDLYATSENASLSKGDKKDRSSVRCVMGDGAIPESSSSSAASSSSSSWAAWTSADSGSTFVFDLSVPKEAYLNPDVQYGTLVDSRDEQTYKTVQIGDQVWMAENLNYASEGSACFNDTASYCELFGRLYYWSTAMDSAGTWSDHGKGCGYNKTCTPTYPVRGICPDGWHLPSAEEFNKLIDAVGGLDSASRKLMSPVGWYDHFMTAQFHADNSTGFSAIASGGKTMESGFWGLGRGTGFFSSTEFNVYNARNMSLYPSEPAVGTTAKKGMESVRCIKN